MEKWVKKTFSQSSYYFSIVFSNIEIFYYKEKSLKTLKTKKAHYNKTTGIKFRTDQIKNIFL